MMAGRSVAAENNLNSASVLVENRPRITAEITVITIVAFNGVLNRGDTLCRTCHPGNRSSRDIAHTSRTPVIKMTRPQAKIAMATSTSSAVPTNEPRMSRITSAIGVPDSASATGSLTPAVTTSRKRKPSTPEARTACHMARGTTTSGCLVSSARLAADSNPTIVNAPSRKPSIHGPTVVAVPKLQYPSAGTSPRENRFPTLSLCAITPTMNSSTINATMPTSSAVTAKLFTRSVHFVDRPTSNACMTMMTAVIRNAEPAVPSKANRDGRTVEATV